MSTDIQRLLALMHRHSALLERIYHEREVYIAASERAAIDTLSQLRRERVVRTEPDASGGMTVRLSSHVRELLGTTQRHRRLQNIGVGVKDAIETLEHLTQSWKAAVSKGDDELAGDVRDQIMDLLDNVELLYEEQLEGLAERISVSYGFDERREQSSRDFLFYRKRLSDMVEGTRELDATLESEEYEGVEPVETASVRIAHRLRKHGAEITRLRRELERYLIRFRNRQALTRRWVRKVQWLRRQHGKMRAENALVAAAELPLLRRAPGMELRGRPDLRDPRLDGTWSELLVETLRWRRDAIRPRLVERPESGIRRNDPESEALTRQQAEAERARRWQSERWLTEYLEAAVRATVDPSKPGLSAMRFWRERVAKARPGEALPTARAWLSEVVMLACTDRRIHGRQFSAAYDSELDPAPQGPTYREPRVIHDIRVRVRPEVVRRHRQQRKIAIG